MSLAPRASFKAPLAKRINLGTALTVAAMHLLAGAALISGCPDRATLASVLALHFLTGGLGLGVGYHRLLSHRSFVPKRWLENVLATLGALTFQVGPLTWAAMHRAHHAHEDRLGDPHAASRGLWWSHVGWVFLKAPNGYRYRAHRVAVPDLVRNPYLSWLERNWTWLNLTAFGAGVAAFGWERALWLFPLRIVAVWHTVWLINSMGHRREAGSEGGTSLNQAWIAMLTYGEGWHRNHHQTPRSADNQREWYELDLNHLMIRGMTRLGWVRRRSASPIHKRDRAA